MPDVANLGASWPPGAFVAFEGPEGSGKSSQLARLAQRLESAGFEVTSTREPGGTVLGERLRQLLLDPAAGDLDPRTEAYLFCAARTEHVRLLIQPALRSGRVVLCDRFADATVAYQGYGGGVSVSLLARMNALATGGLTPDLTVLLDIPVSEGLARRKRGQCEWTRLDDADVGFHERVRAGYMALARQHPERWAVIDARTGPDAVAEEVWATVHARLVLPAAATETGSAS